MKTLKISTKTIIVIYVILISGLSSCEEAQYPSETTKWRVERIEPNKNGTSLYLVHPIDKKDLNVSCTWFVDSVGKFNAGDTLSFYRL